MKHDRSAIIEQLHKSMQRLRGQAIDIQDFTEDAHLAEDLDLDSLDRLEILFDIEENWGVHLADDEAEALTTVRDVVNTIESKLTGTGVSRGDAPGG